MLAALLAGCAAQFDCEDPESSGWSADLAPEEEAMLAEVNAHRAAGAVCNGVDMPPVGALVMDDALRCAARGHAVDLGTQDYFAHEGLDGSTPAERAEDAGYEWSRIAENISGGRDNAADTVTGLLESTTGHCENIMQAEVTEAGMGAAIIEGSTYTMYWVQVFGAPL